jgi:nucleoside-diphosphate-sugar epimerase
VERGAQVQVVDDLTSGRRSNIEQHVADGRVKFVEADLREPGVTRAAMNGAGTSIYTKPAPPRISFSTA